MEGQQKIIARRCLDGFYDNSLSFPAGVQALTEAGFEGYHVDYRLNTCTYYLPSGEALVLKSPHRHGTVGERFNEVEIAKAIQWAQRSPPDYSYMEFSRKVTTNGCAGYVVSMLGRRVVYLGRTAETHEEHFPA